MTLALKHIAKTLGEGRKSKGLSQRALSALSGVPQGHISNIEAGEVDLRLSSLIELARALDMELMLVPRAAVPAVQSIIRGSKPAASRNRLAPQPPSDNAPARPAYTLDEDDNG